jgi:hypothetical protein
LTVTVPAQQVNVPAQQLQLAITATAAAAPAQAVVAPAPAAAQPVTVQAVQAQPITVQAVQAQPVYQAQAVTVQPVVYQAQAVTVQAAAAVQPTAMAVTVTQPGLVGRWIGHVGSTLALAGQPRAYLPAQAAPVQQVVYNPPAPQAITYQPTYAPPVQAVTASPQYLPVVGQAWPAWKHWFHP